MPKITWMQKWGLNSGLICGVMKPLGPAMGGLSSPYLLPQLVIHFLEKVHQPLNDHFL